MKKRCIWTNRKSDNLKEIIVKVPNRIGLKPQERTFYILPEYESNFRRFAEYVTKYAILFLLLVLGSIIAIIIFGTVGIQTAFNITVIFLGVLTILFPFATPETVAMCGVRISIWLARVCGLLAIGCGILLLLK
ncbi:MAG: hypothetical protein AB1349_00330 [Elusimicrobiota bacterium]